jgi:hypothetical protein
MAFLARPSLAVGPMCTHVARERERERESSELGHALLRCPFCRRVVVGTIHTDYSIKLFAQSSVGTRLNLEGCSFPFGGQTQPHSSRLCTLKTCFDCVKQQ